MPTNGGPSANSGFSTSGGVNYAARFADKVDERFKLKSLVAPATNNDFKFDGVNSVNVYSIDTVPLTDYTPYGENRFGTTVELGNAVQTLTLTQRKAFSFSIDFRSSIAASGAMNAGAALDREMSEQVVPTYDKYVLNKLFTSAKNANKFTANLTSANAYTSFLQIQDAMGNAKVPLNNRVAFVTYGYISLLKAGNDFVLASDKGQTIRQTGELGTVDGTKIIAVPSDYMPNANVRAIVIASNVVIAPRPIDYYTVHTNPPGIHGWKIEGDFLYDCFVLNNKLDAICVLSQSSG